MKISFYFTLWMGFYVVYGVVAELLRLPQNLPFIVILFVVGACARAFHMFFAESIASEKANATALRYELIYSGEGEEYLRGLRRSMREYALLSVYVGLCLIGMFGQGATSFIDYAIFGAAFILNVISLVRHRKAYRLANRSMLYGEKMELSYEDVAPYERFCEARKEHESVASMLVNPRGRSFQTLTLIFAGLSSLLGIFVMLCMSFLDSDSPEVLSLFLYGSLAIAYGIRDIVEAGRRRLERKALIANTDYTAEGAEGKERLTFPAAVKFLFSFKGKTRRTPYIIVSLVYSAVNLVCSQLARASYDPSATGVASLLLLLCIWVMLAVGCKRCHAFGYSGWFQLIPGWHIVMLFMKGDSRQGRAQFPDIREL